MISPDNKSSFLSGFFNKKISFSFGRKKKIEDGELVENKSGIIKNTEHKIYDFFSHHGLLVIVLILPILIGGVASYLYDIKYQDRVFNGVEILGIDAGGKTKEELSEELNNKVSKYTLEFEGGNQYFKANFKDLGIVYDKNKMLDEAFSFGRDGSVLDNYTSRTKGVLSDYSFDAGFINTTFDKKRIIPSYAVNDSKLEKFLGRIEKKINVTPKNSSITTNGSSIKVMPAVFGRKLKTEELKKEVVAAAVSFQDKPLQIKTETWSPKILDEKAQKLAEEADELASKKVVFTYKGKDYYPTKDIVVSWITFVQNNKKSDWKMVIDQSKMYSYFDTVGGSINTLPVNQKVRVENGTKEKVLQKGKNGLVINKALLASQVASGLKNDSSVELPIPMMVAYYQTFKDYVIVANWAKYIEINISTQTMTAYEKGGKKVGRWSITSGQNNIIEGSNTNTPTGTFLIRGKANDICMPNPPGDGKLCHIHYVSYFTPQGHAIHEAWWRSYFGSQDYVWNGSHGCINSPLYVAKFIYYWAPLGTPVIIHY